MTSKPHFIEISVREAGVLFAALWAASALSRYLSNPEYDPKPANDAFEEAVGNLELGSWAAYERLRDKLAAIVKEAAT